MLATDSYSNSRFYQNQWIDNYSFCIPWLNFLTAQSIPEESDVTDYSLRSRNDSICSSSSSLEDCYFVVDVQPTSSIDNKKEEELNSAQINEMEYEELAESMVIEVPWETYAIEHQPEQPAHLSNTLFFHTSEELDKSISVSDDDSLIITELKVNEHRPLSEPQCLIISLDSIEDKSPLTSTFSHHRSSQHELPPIHTQQEKSVIEHATLTHISMEKINYTKEETIRPCDFSNKSKPAFLRLIKKRNRTVKSDYYSSYNDTKTNEPSLIQVKYFDGRPTLIDTHAQKTDFSTNSSRNLSYRKRILNRFQTFLKPSSTDQSKSSQHKTIFELFNQKKYRTDRY